MAFKMKGSPMARNFGIGAPTKKTDGTDNTDGKDNTDDRSLWEKAKDEGSQIMAGFRGGNSASDPSRGGGTTSYFSGFGKGYTAEENRQAAERKKN